MNNQEIAVNTSILERDITDLQSTLDRVRKRLRSMADEITTLNGMWEGDANAAFNVQFKKDYNEMEGLCNTISSLIDCMRYAKREYETCEGSVNGVIGSMKI